MAWMWEVSPNNEPPRPVIKNVLPLFLLHHMVLQMGKSPTHSAHFY
jgi:hypothetical protein